MTTKFHSTFGEVKVIESSASITTIMVVSTGETKKLVTKAMFLQDEPFAAKVAAPKVNANKIAQDHLNNMTHEQMAELKRVQREIAADKARSARDRANGNHGAISMWK